MFTFVRSKSQRKRKLFRALNGMKIAQLRLLDGRKWLMLAIRGGGGEDRGFGHPWRGGGGLIVALEESGFFFSIKRW